MGKPKLLCLVCNIKTAADLKPYNEGGLGRCSEKGSKEKMTNSMKRRNKPEDNYQQAAQRLNLNVYYHRRCYTNFVREKELKVLLVVLGYLEGVRVSKKIFSV